MSDIYMLPGIVLLLPLASALVIMLFHSPLRTIRISAPTLSTLSVIVTFVCSVMLLMPGKDIGGAPDESGALLFPFLKVGDFTANISFIVDSQAKGMLFIVTFIGMLVHIFSLGYMRDDAGKDRYFGGLSLFMFSMTGIVLADNLIMMFIFWELVGISSYILIGHWYEKASAADAAKKAFITNRIGDFGFMTGILLVFGCCGTVGIKALQGQALNGGALDHIIHHYPTIATLMALGLFMGAVGKSAQVPLHVWLPDAMEGPTPISALIHAATMVAAGVYMLARVFFIIAGSHFALQTISIVGGVTALLAALMATQQNDIKKILAYSTLSQLGYMVMAVGLASPEAGMFHLYTHAFFKALLFLGSGAVIYACHHEQDIWQMGGLSKTMPGTFWTFVIGTAALMGVPWITSGFYSKEAILNVAYAENGWLFFIGAFTAFLTAFYMTRLVVVAFLGKPRGEGASHAHEAPLVLLAPLVILAIPAIISPFIAEPLHAMTPKHEHGSFMVVLCSLIALGLGIFLGITLYLGKSKDPVRIPLFAKKFYFDEIYAWIVSYVQDTLAWILSAIDKGIIDGLTTRLPAGIARGLGSWSRRLQGGSIQGYTFLFGLGVVILVYLTVFITQAVQKH